MSESKQNEIPVVEPGVTYNFNDFETLKKFMFDFMCSFITMEQSHDFAVSYEEFQKRLNICSQCDMFNKEKMKCEQCGCLVLKKIKSTFETCPTRKWEEDNVSFENIHFGKILANISGKHFAIGIDNGGNKGTVS